jgi:signal transduction histidine kinase
MQQVFLNILNNAYDAMRDSGNPRQVEVSSTLSGEYVEVRFKDSGTGIAEPERIFDPFFTTKEVGKGTGLGLSICYGIIHEHKGEITAHNNAPEVGATFIVRLPAATKTSSERVGAVAGAKS